MDRGTVCNYGIISKAVLVCSVQHAVRDYMCIGSLDKILVVARD